MMAVTLDDGTALSEISVFNEQFEKHRDKLKEDRLLIVQGKVQRDEFIGGLRVTADDLLDLASLRARLGARLRIEMNGATDKARDPKRLMDLLAPYRAGSEGGCPVLVHYENAGASCDVALGEAWRVRPDERMLGGERERALVGVEGDVALAPEVLRRLHRQVGTASTPAQASSTVDAVSLACGPAD
jgi:DNA polymerase-3 subunit alpha